MSEELQTKLEAVDKLLKEITETTKSPKSEVASSTAKNLGTAIGGALITFGISNPNQVGVIISIIGSVVGLGSLVYGWIDDYRAAKAIQTAKNDTNLQEALAKVERLVEEARAKQ